MSQNNDFVFACLTTDIPLGKAKNMYLAYQEVAIFHTDDGFLARSGLCKHNAFKLELCEISGDIVRCPRHDWKYQISSGEGIKPNKTCLDSFPVEIRGQEIWVKPVVDDSGNADYDTSAYQW